MSIITTQQYKMLTILSRCDTASRQDLQAETSIPNGTYDIHMGDLKEREFVTIQPMGRYPSRISITMAGQRALDDHNRHWNMFHSPDRAAPSRINIFAQPVYVPSKNLYFRNKGNAHIASKGACA